jgi:hypothetical protein
VCRAQQVEHFGPATAEWEASVGRQQLLNIHHCSLHHIP